jgi:hypothetical protein
LSHWEFPFFGLEPSDRADVLLEKIFLLMYHMGFSYKEAYNLPVAYARFFLDRVVRELNRTSEDGTTMSKGMAANTPDLRELRGQDRSHVPARLRRFT